MLNGLAFKFVRREKSRERKYQREKTTTLPQYNSSTLPHGIITAVILMFLLNVSAPSTEELMSYPPSSSSFNIGF